MNADSVFQNGDGSEWNTDDDQEYGGSDDGRAKENDDDFTVVSEPEVDDDQWVITPLSVVWKVGINGTWADVFATLVFHASAKKRSRMSYEMRTVKGATLVSSEIDRGHTIEATDTSLIFTFDTDPGKNVIRAILNYRHEVINEGLLNSNTFVIPSVYTIYPVEKYWNLGTMESSITINIHTPGKIVSVENPSHNILISRKEKLYDASCYHKFEEVPREDIIFRYVYENSRSPHGYRKGNVGYVSWWPEIRSPAVPSNYETFVVLDRRFVYDNSGVIKSIVSGMLEMPELTGTKLNIILPKQDGSPDMCWKQSVPLDKTSLREAIDFLARNLEDRARAELRTNSICPSMKRAFDNRDRKLKQNYVIVSGKVDDIQDVRSLYDGWRASSVSAPKPMFVVFDKNVRDVAYDEICDTGEGFALFQRDEDRDDVLHHVFKTVGQNTIRDAKKSSISTRGDIFRKDGIIDHHRIRKSNEFQVRDNDRKVKISDSDSDKFVMVNLIDLKNDKGPTLDNLDETTLANINKARAMRDIPLPIKMLTYYRINHHRHAVKKDMRDFFKGLFSDTSGRYGPLTDALSNELLLHVLEDMKDEWSHDETCTRCISNDFGDIDTDDKSIISNDDANGRNANVIETISRFVYKTVRDMVTSEEEHRAAIKKYLPVITYIKDQYDVLDKKSHVRWTYCDAMLQSVMHFLTEENLGVDQEQMRWMADFSKTVASTYLDRSPERYFGASLNKARYHVEQSDFQDAVNECKAILTPFESHMENVRGTVFDRRAQLLAIMARTIMGNCYKSMGELDNAERLLTDALVKRTRLLPPGHNDIGKSKKYVGAMYAARNDIERALGYFEDALSIMEKLNDRLEIAAIKYQIANLKFLTVQSNIVDMTRKKEVWNEVHGLYIEVIETRILYFGNEHMSVSGPIMSMSSLLNAMGKYAEATNYARKCLDIRTKHLSSDDVRIATTRYILGKILKKDNKDEEALEHAKEAYRIRLSKLGADHSDTKLAKKLLDPLLFIQKQTKVLRRVGVDPDVFFAEREDPNDTFAGLLKRIKVNDFRDR